MTIQENGSPELCLVIPGRVRVPVHSPIRRARHRPVARLRGAANTADAGKASRGTIGLSGDAEAKLYK